MQPIPAAPSANDSGRRGWAIRALLALGTCLAAAGSMATPVFLESSMTATASARAWITQPTVSQTAAYQFNQPMGSHRVDASAYSNNTSHGAEVLASEHIEATFNGESNGTVSMQTSMVARNPAEGRMSLTDGWTYRFRAGADSVVHVHYDVDADPFVVNNSSSSTFTIGLLDLSSVTLRADTEGVYSWLLEAGEVYDLIVRPAGTIYMNMNSDVDHSFNGFFAWSIEDRVTAQAVPEPAGLTLVLTALLAAAAAAGRRRHGHRSVKP